MQSLVHRLGRSAVVAPAFAAAASLACAASDRAGDPPPGVARAAEEAPEARFERRRLELVRKLEAKGIRDAAVLDAMRAVPRHELVPRGLVERAYEDRALPIGLGQTISQPYVVAFMTEAARLRPDANVLEVGTGSGFQAAVLAEVLGLGPRGREGSPRGRLCTIEILPELATRAARDLARLGYRDVAVRAGDGYRGWPERAPFDAIIVTAAPDHVPAPLEQQLAVGGRLIIPVGEGVQDLLVIRRGEAGLERESVLPVRFVEMTGEAQR